MCHRYLSLVCNPPKNHSLIIKLQISDFEKLKKALDNLISELENIEHQDSAEIKRVVKDTVLKLNKLNESGEFIDTLEREDICLFINRAATEAGLTINQGEDITQEFRTW